ncbi:D-aminoacyl-tRNA deacylase [Clostridioides difficile]
MNNKKAVFFFCNNLDKDPVAKNVINYCEEVMDLKQTDIVVDDNFVLEFTDKNNNLFQFVKTKNVISHDYKYYLPILNKYFKDFDFAGVVNWHEGENAPANILTAHTIGDVPTGEFGNSNPKYFRNLINAIEDIKNENSLDEFTTLTEATHWSGTTYGEVAKLITEYSVPMLDIEIGSNSTSFNNKTAIQVLAKSLIRVFDNDEPIKTLLCVGGVHFENSFADIIKNREYNISIGHVLPNQWIVSGMYDNEDGFEKLEKCVDSIDGGIDGIVFHDKLKGTYKEQCRKLGQKLKVPVFKHKILKNPKDLPIW